MVEREAGAVVDDGGWIKVAGGAVGAAPTGAVVPGADSAQVEVGTAAVVHRGVSVIVAAGRIGAAVDDPADADVVHRDVGDVGHSAAGGIAIDQLDAPFAVPGETGAAEVDRGRVGSRIPGGPVSRPQGVVAEVGAAGRDGAREPTEFDALAGRSRDDHQHVSGPTSGTRRVVERDVEGADFTGAGEGRRGARRAATEGLGDAQVGEAIADAPDRWVGAGPVVDCGVRIVVAGGAVGAAHAARAVTGTDAANVKVGTAAVVHRGVGVVVAERRVRAAEAAEVAGAVIGHGVRVVVAGTGIGAAEHNVAHADLGGFAGSEITTGGEHDPVLGEFVSAVAIGAAHAIAEAVVDGERVASVTDTGGLDDRAAASVRATSPDHVSIGIGQVPGGFPWVVVQREGQGHVDALGVEAEVAARRIVGGVLIHATIRGGNGGGEGVVPVSRGQGAEGNDLGLAEFEGARPGVRLIGTAVHAVGDGGGGERVGSVVEQGHTGVHLRGTGETGWGVDRVDGRVEVEVRDGGQAAIAGEQADTGAAGAEEGLHAVGLTLREDVHAGVIRVVHVILDHVLRAAADVAEGAAVVGAVGFGGVRHEVVGPATAIAPDVAQVEPVADLVGGRAAKVVGTGSGTVESRELIAADDAVGGRVAARELGVAEQSAAEVADPEVHVLIGRPGIGAAGAGELDVVRGAESTDRRGHPEDAVRRGAVRIAGGEAEFDFRVGGLRPEVVLVGVHPAEVIVQDLELLEEALVRNVLGAVRIDDVEDHWNGHDHGLHLGAVGPGLLAGLHKGGRLLFDVRMVLGIRRIHTHHLDMLLVCGTGALGRRLRGLDLGREGDAHAQGGKERGNSHVWLVQLADKSGPSICTEPREIATLLSTLFSTLLSVKRLQAMGFDVNSPSASENSSVGRAQPCQGWGREFESRFSLRV